MDESTKKTLDFYNQYAEEFYEKTKTFHNSRWFKSFFSLMPPNGKILDLGCAFGRDCRYFVESGFDTYGVDFSNEMIKKAKKFVPEAKFRVMDVLDLKFDKSFFDGVWCSAVLLHIKKLLIPKALSEINKVMKRGGILFLYLKGGKGEEIVKDKRYGGVEKFYSYFQKNEMKKMLINAGFNLIELKNVDFVDKYRSEPGFYVLAKKG